MAAGYRPSQLERRFKEQVLELTDDSAPWRTPVDGTIFDERHGKEITEEITKTWKKNLIVSL